MLILCDKSEFIFILISDYQILMNFYRTKVKKCYIYRLQPLFNSTFFKPPETSAKLKNFHKIQFIIRIYFRSVNIRLVQLYRIQHISVSLQLKMCIYEEDFSAFLANANLYILHTNNQK